MTLNGHTRNAQKLSINDLFMADMLGKFARDDFYELLESAMLDVSRLVL